MSGTTPGSRQSPGQSDVYWRRRVIALAAAIGVLALIAWTVNGTLGGAGNAQTAADTTHTGQHAKHGIAPAAATSPAISPRPARPTAATAATPRPTASAHGQARHGQQAKHAAAKHGQAKSGRHQAGPGTAAGGRAAACPRGSVVLSLFTTKYRYPAHQAPRFELDVVSTAPRPCSFDLGARHVQLVIKAGGERQVWDSADCAAAGHRMTRLSRGVPDVLQVSWDRKTAAASCRLAGKAARPGTYTATVRSGPLHSQSLIFVLGGPGIAVP